MKKHKYTATRCQLITGADMENMTFSSKAKAVAWAKRCRFGKVRDQSVADRPVVYEHSKF